MENANKNIDRYVREKSKGEDYERELEKAFSLRHDRAPHLPSGTSEIIKRTKNFLLKPQLKFIPKMDNSYFQFVPIITHKENQKSPLHERIRKLQADYAIYQRKNQKIEFNKECEIPYTRIPHPYEEEIVDVRIDWKNMMEEISNLNPKLPRPVDE